MEDIDALLDQLEEEAKNSKDLYAPPEYWLGWMKDEEGTDGRLSND